MTGLNRLCQKWQRILRLQDWDVSVRYGDSNETSDGQASVSTYPESKLALVWLLKPEARSAEGEWQKAFPGRWWDDEQLIVHELLHVRFDQIIEHPEKGSVEHSLEEQAIEAVAMALVGLDRKAANDH